MKSVLLGLLVLGFIFVQGCAYTKESAISTKLIKKDGKITEEVVKEEKCRAGLLVPLIPVPCSWIYDDDE